jgi:hypothetical protein
MTYQWYQFGYCLILSSKFLYIIQRTLYHPLDDLIFSVFFMSREFQEPVYCFMYKYQGLAATFHEIMKIFFNQNKKNLSVINSPVAQCLILSCGGNQSWYWWYNIPGIININLIDLLLLHKVHSKSIFGRCINIIKAWNKFSSGCSNFVCVKKICIIKFE